MADHDKKLLLAFCKWLGGDDGERFCRMTRETPLNSPPFDEFEPVDADNAAELADAFLATRQPQAAPPDPRADLDREIRAARPVGERAK